MAELHYMSETKTETLGPEVRDGGNVENYCNTAKDEDGKLGTYKPTHVVTAITYGGNAHILFQKVCVGFDKKGSSIYFWLKLSEFAIS